jgi:hypothetical protein
MSGPETESTDPATDLRQAYRNCSPRPLRSDHPWYTDLGELRGGDVKPRIIQRFEFKEIGVAGLRDTWMRLLMLGLRGSGKTTEIHRLAADLRHRYVVLYLEANTELNAEDFDLSELILAIAVGVERHMREFEHKPLAKEALEGLQGWFAKVTRENIEERVAQVEVQGKLAPESAPGPAKFFTSVLGMLKRTSTERERVVQQIRKYPAELVAYANDLLREARAPLGDRELLVVVDNLDRYNPETIDRCLSAGAEYLQSLDLNLIVTPPVSLLLDPRTEPLNNLYQTEFMYTPALRGPEDPPERIAAPALRVFREALGKRIQLDAVFAEPDAVLEQVLRVTGGSLRDLMEHLREAIVIAKGPKLTVDDVNAAMRKRVGLIRDQVRISGKAELLAQIEQTHALPEGTDALQLLYRRWIFKYNGDEWYALHPYVRSLPEIQRLLGARESGA